MVLESRQGHGGFATLDFGHTFTAGVEGTALSLDGASQRVDLPDLLPTTHTMTLGATELITRAPGARPVGARFKGGSVSVFVFPEGETDFKGHHLEADEDLDVTAVTSVGPAVAVGANRFKRPPEGEPPSDAHIIPARIVMLR